MFTILLEGNSTSQGTIRMNVKCAELTVFYCSALMNSVLSPTWEGTFVLSYSYLSLCQRALTQTVSCDSPLLGHMIVCNAWTVHALMFRPDYPPPSSPLTPPPPPSPLPLPLPLLPTSTIHSFPCRFTNAVLSNSLSLLHIAHHTVHNNVNMHVPHKHHFIHVSVFHLKNRSVLYSHKISILGENYTGERVGVIHHYHKVQPCRSLTFFICTACKAWVCLCHIAGLQ